MDSRSMVWSRAPPCTRALQERERAGLFMSTQTIAIEPVTRAAVPERIQLYGVEIDAITFDQTLDRAFELADMPSVSQHVVLNAAKVVLMAKDDQLRRIIAGCALVN